MNKELKCRRVVVATPFLICQKPKTQCGQRRKECVDLKGPVNEGLNPRGGTPLYGLYRYVRPQRVEFVGRFGHK